MLASVLGWGRVNRISEAKLTQVNLLLDHLNKVIKANLNRRARAPDFTTNILFFFWGGGCQEGAKGFLLPNVSFPVPQTTTLGHECISVNLFIHILIAIRMSQRVLL